MRPHLFISLLVLTSAPALFVACAADVEESCVGGNCKFEGYVTPDVSGGDDGGAPMGAAACAAGPTTGDFPCDVFDVIQRRCFACHGDPKALVGPFSIYSYEDTQQPYAGTELVFQSMAKAIGPKPPIAMPLGGPPLNAEDAKILGDWLNSCAMPVAEGTGCQCPQPGMGCMP